MAQEAIDILTALKTVIVNSVCTKISLFTKKEGIALFIELAHLYESVFSDGRCGVCHYHIGELYLHAASYEARFGEGIDTAFANKSSYITKIPVSLKIQGSLFTPSVHQ